MALTLSGRLYDPFGTALENAGVRFRAARTSTQVLANYSAETTTDSSGDYTITVQYATYHIEARQSARDPWYTIARNIPVTTETTSTDINALIVAYVGAGDATPEIVLEIEAIAATASAAAAAATAAAEDAVAAASSVKVDTTLLVASQYGAQPGTNVTEALQLLSADARALGGGFTAVIDCGEAEVFEQTVNPTPGNGDPYYIPTGDPLDFTGCTDFTVDLSGCKLSTASGLRFGAFDQLTGEPTASISVDEAEAVHIGVTLNLDGCKRYVVKNPDFFGNNENLVYGNEWGDTGTQLWHFGIREWDAEQGVIINPRCDYFALDGMYTGGHSKAINHLNPVCEYNGRQGLSLTGCNNLNLFNPRYRYTGKAGIFSLPGSGLDIEDNGQGCYNVNIYNPDFVSNEGVDLLILNKTDNINIYGGVIATEKVGLYSTTVGVTFHQTRLYCHIQAAQNGCRFIRTLHEDVEYDGVKIEDGRVLFENNGRAILDGAEFVMHDSKRIYITNQCEAKDTTFRFVKDSPVNAEQLANVSFSKIKDCDFVAEFTNASADISDSGNRAYVNYLDPISEWGMQGDVRVIGDGLAMGSRFGSSNSNLNALRNVNVYSYRSEHVASGTSLTIEIPVGAQLVSVSSGRNSVLIAIATSQPSGASERHGAAIVASATDLVSGFDYSMGISNGLDSLTISDGSDTIDGKTWVVSSLYVGGSSVIGL